MDALLENDLLRVEMPPQHASPRKGAATSTYCNSIREVGERDKRGGCDLALARAEDRAPRTSAQLLQSLHTHTRPRPTRRVDGPRLRWQISTSDRTHARTGPDTPHAQAQDHTRNTDTRKAHTPNRPHSHTHTCHLAIGERCAFFHSCRNRQRSPYRQPLGALKFLQSLRL